MLKQTLTQAPKNKLSLILRSWLPLLQANIDELNESINEYAKDNPFIKVKSSRQKYFGDMVLEYQEDKNLDDINIINELKLQINNTLFPTQKSKDIANLICESLDENGYFEYDKDTFKDYLKEEVEKVRQRFIYLEPSGVGAKDYKEAFLFCLESKLFNGEIKDDEYKFCKELINELENLANYKKHKLFKPCMQILRSFSVPPFLNYSEKSQEIVPDIFVYHEDGQIKVRINDEYYPEVSIDEDSIKEHKYMQEFIKNAKNIVDALAMRKATLKKIALMIVEYQYEFFLGGDIKPMRLKDIADELDRNPSTISRAIAGKYLFCSRGMVELKNFFATKIDDDTSNAVIKEYLLKLVKNEDKKKPLSDIALLEMIEKDLGVKIVRRTITKYRKQLDIAPSHERKRLYELW